MPNGVARLWDISSSTGIADFSVRDGSPITDVASCPGDPQIFATSCASGSVLVWDVRSPDSSARETPLTMTEAHSGGSHCVAFTHGNHNVLATGGADGVVRLWDARRLTGRLHRFKTGSSAGVSRIVWAPFDNGLLAVGNNDGRISILDLCQIGAKQLTAEAKDGPPELVFTHGGHAGSLLADISWSPEVQWLLASASLDEGLHSLGQMQLWQPAMSLRPK